MVPNTPPRRGLLFVGNYGNRNVGDDAILQALSARYAATHPDCDQYVFARCAPDDIRHICVAQPLMPSLRAVLWVLWHVRVVVIGGGGLFGANMGPLARFIPLFALLCQLLGKQLVYESVGFYRNTPPLQRALLWASMLVARRVSVRDATSWEMTAPIRRLRPVALVDDPGLAIRPVDPVAARALLRAEGIALPDERTRVVGLSVKRIIKDGAGSQRLLEALVPACRWLADQGYHLLFLTFCHDPAKWSEQDVAFADELIAALDRPGAASCVRGYYAPQEVAGMVGLTGLLIGMRFHAQVFAHALGVPLLPIAYEDKRTDFIARYGYPTLPIAALDGSELIAHCAAVLPEGAMTVASGCPTP